MRYSSTIFLDLWMIQNNNCLILWYNIHVIKHLFYYIKYDKKKDKDLDAIMSPICNKYLGEGRNGTSLFSFFIFYFLLFIFYLFIIYLFLFFWVHHDLCFGDQ